MRELVVVAGHLGHRRLHGFDQVGLAALRIGPFRLRLQHDEVVGDVGRHRVGGDLGRAELSENPVHLRELLDGLLQLRLHLDRLRQAGAGNSQGMQSDIAFVKTRHELAAHAGGQQRGERHGDNRDGQDERLVEHGQIEHRRVAALGPPHQAVFLFADLVADQQRHGGRNEGDRQDHGAQQGGHHGECHRVEHLALHAGEREDRQVHHHDDELAEQQRLACFPSGREHFVKALVARQCSPRHGLRMSQPPHAVLHDHHGAVDDNAEVQRPQAHQVSTDLVGDHAGEGEQHGKRDDQGSDDRRADVAEKQEQDHDHQNSALDQILLDGIDRLVHQYRAVIDGLGDHAFWQGAVDLFQALGDSLGDRAAVFSDQHEHGAEHHLATILGCGAGAQFLADADFGHIPNSDRDGLTATHNDVADVFDVGDLAGRTDQILLAALFDITGAHVAVVALDRADQILQCQAVSNQLVGQGRDLKFLGVTADGVDLGHAGHIAQLRFDDPVLDLAQVGGGVGRAIGLARAFPGLDRPHENLPEAGGDRPHAGLGARRQLAPGLLDSLVDELAREVDIGAILEDDRDLRQAVARQRPGLLQTGQAGHDGLDRVGNTLLGFKWRIAGRSGVDLYLHVGDVGYGVDRQLLVVINAQRCHAEHHQQHQPALTNGKTDDFFEHGKIFPSKGRRRRVRRSEFAARRQVR